MNICIKKDLQPYLKAAGFVQFALYLRLPVSDRDRNSVRFYRAGISLFGSLREFFPGCLEQSFILHKLYGGERQRLCCQKHPLVRKGSFAAAHILPGMSGRSQGKAGCVDLRGRGEPAYISDVSGARSESPGVVNGH